MPQVLRNKKQIRKREKIMNIDFAALITFLFMPLSAFFVPQLISDDVYVQGMLFAGLFFGVIYIPMMYCAYYNIRDLLREGK